MIPPLSAGSPDATHELARERWGRYLEDVSIELLNAEVSIEIAEPGEPSRVQARHLALQALAYDPRSDVFEVAGAHGGPHGPSVLRHMVDHPRRIAVDSPGPITPTTMWVDDAEGRRTVVRIMRPGQFTG